MPAVPLSVSIRTERLVRAAGSNIIRPAEVRYAQVDRRAVTGHVRAMLLRADIAVMIHILTAEVVLGTVIASLILFILIVVI